MNAENLNYNNLWTEALWSAPQSEEDATEPPVHPNEFEVLLAGPRGKVLRANVERLDAWSPNKPLEIRDQSGARLATLELLDLKHETEIWNQLRNGTVAGRALIQGEQRVVPLVNVTSLTEIPSAKQPLS